MMFNDALFLQKMFFGNIFAVFSTSPSVFFYQTLIIMRDLLGIIFLFTFVTFNYNFSSTEKILNNGWEDIIEVKEQLMAQHEDVEDVILAFEEELTGTRVRFKGYLKQVAPHHADNRDYYLTAEMEQNCLPFYQVSEYCGKGNPDYMRVIFNGAGKENKDMDILLKPHRNKHFKTKGKLQEKELDNGNYKVFTYDKNFELEAVIKMATLKCRTTDCSDRYITIHIDGWEFLD